MTPRRPFLLIASGLLAVLVAPGPAYSDPRESNDTNREADRKAIMEAGRAIAEAFARGDAPAVAAGWCEQCEYYDDAGEVLHGRASIERAYAELFREHPGCTIEAHVKSIRFPSRDSAIVEGTLIIRTPGNAAPQASRYSVLRVREDGVWRIAVAREWGAHEDRLEDLAWLVGEWACSSKDRDTRMSFEWNEKKMFLMSRFSVREAGKVTQSGTHQIGRDPRTGQIRSWVYNDDGGNGEMIWTRDRNRWVIDSSGLTPDGVPTSSVNIITRLGEDRFTWQSMRRVVGADAVPDAPPVTFEKSKPGG
ncbi:MAG: SgcJ/EcaC family oxidoreductase [Phycisphaerae bacterium]|nr:SgcJ/EcaC family oxidoreductase [Phycisphaerae bacterium]